MEYPVNRPEGLKIFGKSMAARIAPAITSTFQYVPDRRQPRRAPVHLVLAFVLVLAGSLSFQPAFAGSKELALRGYDPVSYFSPAGPKRGSQSFVVNHAGMTFAFHTRENASLFQSDPERYTPQFGGNCAFGMAFGSKSSVDPNIWKIVDGKLYLHINAGTQRAWLKKQDNYIKRAETAWKTLGN